MNTVRHTLPKQSIPNYSNTELRNYQTIEMQKNPTTEVAKDQKIEIAKHRNSIILDVIVTEEQFRTFGYFFRYDKEKHLEPLTFELDPFPNGPQFQFGLLAQFIPFGWCMIDVWTFHGCRPK